MKSRIYAGICIFLVLTAVASGAANAVVVRGELSAEQRTFPEDARNPGQHGSNLSFRLQPELFHDWDRGSQRLAMVLFARYDSGDEARTHWDIRELYWRISFGRQLDLYAGIRRVFWGVAETVHLVDVINQTDLVENTDGEDKLGQPMISAAWQTGYGMLDVFIMPYFRERTFPGREGRLRAPIVVDGDRALYESSAGRHRVDFALRYSNYIGDFDFGIAHFSGTRREPLLIPAIDGEGTSSLVPYYYLLDQTSVDVQYTRGDWAWKLEAAHRETNLGSSNAFVGGFEYTLVGILGSDTDLGIIAEYQFDNDSAPVVSDNDIAIGGRLTFNDVANTSLLAFAAIDTENGSTIVSVEGQRRLGEDWRLELEARFFDSSSREDPLFGLGNDSYVELQMVRFF